LWLERCKFNTASSPKLPFVVPINLPYRKLTGKKSEHSMMLIVFQQYTILFQGQDVVSDAYNMTTTDFIPSLCKINYTYKATKNSDKLYTNETSVSPGKYGCPTYDDIFLNDSQGERVTCS
jgi:hypothetical protein